jgi:hypothetical protein
MKSLSFHLSERLVHSNGCRPVDSHFADTDYPHVGERLRGDIYDDRWTVLRKLRTTLQGLPQALHFELQHYRRSV